MANELTNLDVLEVSLVPKAANLRKFLITKAAQPNQEIETLIERIEKVKKELSPDAMEAIDDALESLREAGDEVPRNIIQLLTSLLERSGANNGGGAKPPMPPTPNNNQKGVKKMADMTKEEILKNAPEDMREALEAIYKQKEAAELLLKQQQDQAKQTLYIQKAKDDYSNLSIKPEEFGLVLKELSEKAPEALAKIEEVLKAADAQLKDNVLFKELGGNGAGMGGAPTMTKIDKAAEMVRQANPTMTKEQAITKALELNPDLYNDYLSNRYQ